MEFFRAAALLFGPRELDRLLELKRSEQELRRRRSDLVGAHGWADLDELFDVLRFTDEYIVMRGFEEMSRGNVGADIDLLCRNREALAATLNPDREVAQPPGTKVAVRVGSEAITFDIREVGDGYFDSNWQRAMLERSELYDGRVCVPRDDDHFFGLLYHALLQKPAISDEHRRTMERLSQALAIERVSIPILPDTRRAVELLDGFLAGNQYSVSMPADGHVHRNEANLAKLRLARIEGPSLRWRLNRSLRRWLHALLVRSPLLASVLRRFRARASTGTKLPFTDN